MINTKHFSRRDLHGVLDDEELDDFQLHNLNDLTSFNKPGIKDQDIFSNSGSSTSTVIHNQNASDSKDTFKPINVNHVDTLETDPQLCRKLETTLKINSLNSRSSSSLSTDDDPNRTAQNETTDNTDTCNFNYVENEDDDKLSDYIQGILPSPPSSPPKELDPSRLYAMFDFNGPDPSHLELLKNDPVSLLNDSDSYWWLVKRIDNNKVGFAPAEILETYQERLARLNCWKNEIVERGNRNALSREELQLFNTNYCDSTPQSSNSFENDHPFSIERKGSLKKTNSFRNAKKAVSFADIDETKGINPFKDNSNMSEDSILENGETTDALCVTKRISNSNFMVKNLDDYNSDAESTSKNVNIDQEINLDADVDLEKDKNDMMDAVGNEDQDSLDMPTLNISKQRTKPKLNPRLGSKSMKLLDDLIDNYPEFDADSNRNSINTNIEDGTKDVNKSDGILHPTTTVIFNPIFDQLDKLDSLLKEIEH
ncbi:protein phosphatase regulator [Martiniozyma asiatica (nom. inval.)]|nr:protein phosphatase regulator [Martiniozyma asiatica]